MSHDPPETPLATVDVIIEIAGAVVLVRRRNPPPGWALPGGFVDRGESVAQAARREAKEETRLEVELRELLGVYSDPKRDPRGHTCSVAFLARVARSTPKAGDDAAAAEWVKSWSKLDLAFDHAEIVRDARRMLRSKGF